MFCIPVEQQILVNASAAPLYDAFIENHEWRLKESTLSQEIVEIGGNQISQVHLDLYLRSFTQMFPYF